MKLSSWLLALFALIACALVGACDSPTGSTCPPTNAPDYATFGKPFFETYCLDCHSASSQNRHGAPTDQNYDTEADIKKHAADIDSEAAAGPDATNTAMPELSPRVPHAPSLDERKLLGQFLACEQGHT